MSPVAEQFSASLAGLKPASTLVAGVSGGSDSMALMDLLSRTKHKIVVAHFNHQLRGVESDGDEELVRNEAERRNLEFAFERRDVANHAKGISIEMAARDLRHDFLARTARAQKADIVLAHHADDQVELFLLRLLRGIEGFGLGGMRAIAPSPADPKIRLLRPLLTLSKEQLRAYVTERALTFREDSTNSELKAERNRVRNAIIPSLRAVTGPDFESAILRHVNFIREHEHASRGLADAWLRRKFSALPPQFQRTIIVAQLEREKLPVNGGIISALLAKQPKQVMIAPGVTGSIDSDGKLKVRRESEST